MVTLLVVLLIIGALGGWGYRGGQWAAPGGLIGLVLIVVLVLLLTGRLGRW